MCSKAERVIFIILSFLNNVFFELYRRLDQVIPWSKLTFSVLRFDIKTSLTQQFELYIFTMQKSIMSVIYTKTRRYGPYSASMERRRSECD